MINKMFNFVSENFPKEEFPLKANYSMQNR